MGPPGGPGTFIQNYALLRLLDATIWPAGYVAWVLGCNVANDGGAGLFEYNPTATDADDGGTIIRPANGIGRWFRIFDGVYQVGFWAAQPNGTDARAKIQAALDAAGTTGASVLMSPAGIFLTSGKISSPNGVHFRGLGAAHSILMAQAGSVMTAIIENSDTSGGQEYFFLSDMHVHGNKANGATVTVALVNMVSLFVNSFVRDVVIESGSAVGLRIAGGATQGMGPVLIENTWVLQCNSDNILITENNPPTTAAGPIWLNNVTSENWGAGAKGIAVRGFGGIYNVNMRNIHMEHGIASAVANTDFIYIDGCTGFTITEIDILYGLNEANKRGVVVTNNAFNSIFKIESVFNFNLLNNILVDAKNSVTFSGDAGPQQHINFYTSPEMGIYPNQRQDLTYGVSVATDLANGNIGALTVTNGVAFTMAAPTNARVGQRLTFEIVNATGGAMGVITWTGFAFRDASWANPAAGYRRTISFIFRGSSWIQDGPASGDM